MRFAKLHTYRGAVVAKVAVCLPMIGGFMALSIDMGYITAAHADLVRAADAAALAAVLELNVHTPGRGLPCAGDGLPLSELKARAVERANRTLRDNPSIGVADLRIGADDLELGYAGADPNLNGRYAFTPVDAAAAGEQPNAIALTVGRGDGRGSLSLYFARILGIQATRPTARAVAALSPRAVALVFDNSTHMYHDSQLQHTVLSEAGENPDLRRIFQQVFGGKGWGLMDNFDQEYVLPVAENWLLTTSGDVFARIFDRALEAAGRPEMFPPGQSFPFNEQFWLLVQGTVGGPSGPSVDLEATNDGRTVWHQRLAVMLGLADWHDNGDARLSSDEITFTVPFPGQAGGEGWYDYFDFMMTTDDRNEADYYVFDANSPLSEAEQRARMLTPLEIVGTPELGAHLFMHTFGPRTLINYLLFDQPSGPFSQQFVDQTVEPRDTGFNAVREAAEIFACEFSADATGGDGTAGDALGLVTFDGNARTNVTLTRDTGNPEIFTNAVRQAAVTRDPSVLDAANLAAGINEATATLLASDAISPQLGIVREMVVVTVGWADIDTNGDLKYLNVGHKAHAWDGNAPWLPQEMPTGCFDAPEAALRNARENGIAVSIVSLCDHANKAWFNYLKDEGIIADWISVCGKGASDYDALRNLLGTGRIPFLIQVPTLGGGSGGCGPEPARSTSTQELHAVARALKVVTHRGSDSANDSARTALLQIDGVRLVGEIQNGAELSERIRNLRPDVLVAHLDGADPREQVGRLCNVVKDFEHVALIAVGPTDDAELLHAAMRAGVHDLIGDPVNPEELLDCLQRVLKNLGQRPEGKLIGVRGTGGGSGATTIAVNLAVEIAERVEGRVALVDLDLHFGQVASLLDLTPQFTIADLCQESGEIEQSVLEGAMTESGSGVWVLARPQDPDAEASQVNLVRMEAILSALPGFFEVVIVDENSRSTMTNRMILNMAGNLVIVSRPVVTSIRNAAQMIRNCGSLGYDPDRLKLVLNHMRKKAGGLTIEAIERNLKRKVNFEVPEEPEVICEAINLGKTLREHAPHSKVHSVICELAAALCAGPAAADSAAGPARKSRRKGFRFLFGG